MVPKSIPMVQTWSAQSPTMRQDAVRRGISGEVDSRPTAGRGTVPDRSADQGKLMAGRGKQHAELVRDRRDSREQRGGSLQLTLGSESGSGTAIESRSWRSLWETGKPGTRRMSRRILPGAASAAVIVAGSCGARPAAIPFSACPAARIPRLSGSVGRRRGAAASGAGDRRVDHGTTGGQRPGSPARLHRARAAGRAGRQQPGRGRGRLRASRRASPPVSIAITGMTPQQATPGSTITVTGTLRNTSGSRSATWPCSCWARPRR